MMVMVLISIYGHGHGHFLKEITMRAHQGRPLHLARDPLAYVALFQGSFAADRAHEFLFDCWRLRHRALHPRAIQDHAGHRGSDSL